MVKRCRKTQHIFQLSQFITIFSPSYEIARLPSDAIELPQKNHCSQNCSFYKNQLRFCFDLYWYLCQNISIIFHYFSNSADRGSGRGRGSSGFPMGAEGGGGGKSSMVGGVERWRRARRWQRWLKSNQQNESRTIDSFFGRTDLTLRFRPLVSLQCRLCTL